MNTIAIILGLSLILVLTYVIYYDTVCNIKTLRGKNNE